MPSPSQNDLHLRASQRIEYLAGGTGKNKTYSAMLLSRLLAAKSGYLIAIYVKAGSNSRSKPVTGCREIQAVKRIEEIAGTTREHHDCTMQHTTDSRVRDRR